LSEAIPKLERAGGKLILDVYDEAVMLVKKGTLKLEDAIEIMQEPPIWAPDLPLKAEGWVGPRYKKG
jgi:DNA polymerase